MKFPLARRPPFHPATPSAPADQSGKPAPAAAARVATALLALFLGLGLTTLVVAVGSQSAGLVQSRPFGSEGEGSNPVGELVQATDGNFYGTTTAGGRGYGTVYQVTPAGTLNTLYSFDGTDGNQPNGKLIQATDGSLYGTTSSGGANNQGTVYRITTAGAFTSLHSLTANEGRQPGAGVVQGTDGNFYGTTNQGGTNNTGSLFKITSAGTLTVLHSFGALNSQYTNSDGAYPNCALVQDASGNFFGTAGSGGINGIGTIFRMTPTGVVSDLHDFTSSEGDDPDAGLVIGTDGNFYGTTYSGGSMGYGTVYQFTPGRVLTVLHAFNGYANTNGGGYSIAALIQATDGNFYGTTGVGSYSSSQPTLYQITPAGAYTTIATLPDSTSYFSATAQTGVIQGSDGKLYGTTGSGGTNSLGVVFSVTTGGTYTALHSFVGPASEGTGSQAGLLKGNDGAYYGTTSAGGQNAHGTVFRFAADGTFDLLHSFTGTDGDDSTAGLTEDANGNFYGTTYGGGANSNGVVFQITSAGVYGVLHGFAAFNSGGSTNADGANPRGGVILATDDNLYGTTYTGGSQGYGTVFRLALDGTLTVLYSFTINDGQRPYAGVIQGADGNLYGTTYTGGSLGYGTVFEMTLSGVPTTLYNFSGGADGSNPEAGLVQATDGNFYGTTYSGGANGTGTVFQVTSGGTLTVLHSFAAPTYSGGSSNADGINPTASLIQGSDGILYGTTYSGGSSGDGTVFSITTGGVLTTLFNFDSNGYRPLGGVVQDSNGHFFGTTSTSNITVNGTTSTSGTIYELELVPVITGPATATVNAGQSFTYQIAANNSPTSFGAANLPTGLMVDSTTGLISGTTTQAGVRTVTLSATNAGGTGTATLTLTVNAPPVITSSLSAVGQVGVPFTYRITASNSPTSFGAVGLPAGLTVDATGLISGVPGVDGVFSVVLSAGNTAGTGTARLTLFIDPASTPTPTPGTPTPTPTPGTPTPTPTPGTPTPPPTPGTPTPTPGTPTPTPGTPTPTPSPTPAQPTVTLTSPLDGQSVVAGANLPLAASVVDPANVLVQVQFFIDGSAVGTVSAAPFVFNATAPSNTGSHSVQAVATDRLGRASTGSATLNVTAALPTVPPPTSSVVTPLANRNLVAGSTVALSVTANVDASTSLDHVGLYANGTLVTTFMPGDAATQAVPAGPPTRQDAARAASIVFQTTFTLPGVDQVVNLLAVAVDKLGQSSISRIASIHSTVTTDRPPLVALNGVSNSAHVKVGSINAITVTATAASTNAVAGPRAGKKRRDAAGTLALLEYYLNGAKLGEASAPPYSFNFTPPAAGKYVLDAVATDAAGLASITDPVTVQADVPVVPTVNLAVSGTGAAVEGGANGVVVVSRTGGDDTAALTVSYKAKGAPVAGVDYKKLPGTIIIPAGAPKAKIKVKPLAGLSGAGVLKLKIQLVTPTDGSYAVGTGGVKIKLIGQ